MEEAIKIIRSDIAAYEALRNYDSPFVGQGTCPHNVTAYLSEPERTRIMKILTSAYNKLSSGVEHIEFENIRRILILE